MSTSHNPTKLDLSVYTRTLPPLFVAVMLVATGTGIIFRLRGLSFFKGFFGLWTAALLLLLLIGSFAFAGSYLDRRLGHDVTFRLVGAALAFPITVLAIYNLAPVFGVVGLR